VDCGAARSREGSFEYPIARARRNIGACSRSRCTARPPKVVSRSETLRYSSLSVPNKHQIAFALTLLQYIGKVVRETFSDLAHPRGRRCERGIPARGELERALRDRPTEYRTEDRPMRVLVSLYRHRGALCSLSHDKLAERTPSRSARARCSAPSA
jgi:hypothetical protein